VKKCYNFRDNWTKRSESSWIVKTVHTFPDLLKPAFLIRNETLHTLRCFRSGVQAKQNYKIAFRKSPGTNRTVMSDSEGRGQPCNPFQIANYNLLYCVVLWQRRCFSERCRLFGVALLAEINDCEQSIATEKCSHKGRGRTLCRIGWIILPWL